MLEMFGNEKSVNSIVFEKLQPLNVENKPSLHDSPLTWGQKFEPISVMYYEDRYNTSVLDLVVWNIVSINSS